MKDAIIFLENFGLNMSKHALKQKINDMVRPFILSAKD
jgi:hypothetical protein